jgi:hypothetical protein
MSTQDKVIFPMVRPGLKCLPTSSCGVPMDKGCTQLECHGLSYITYIPFARNLYKLESIVIVHKIRVITLAQDRGKSTYTRAKPVTQHKNTTTRAQTQVLQEIAQKQCSYLTKRLECVVAECRSVV